MGQPPAHRRPEIPSFQLHGLNKVPVTQVWVECKTLCICNITQLFTNTREEKYKPEFLYSYMHKNTYILSQNFLRYCRALHPIRKYKTALSSSVSDSVPLISQDKRSLKALQSWKTFSILGNPISNVLESQRGLLPYLMDIIPQRYNLHSSLFG